MLVLSLCTWKISNGDSNNLEWEGKYWSLLPAPHGLIHSNTSLLAGTAEGEVPTGKESYVKKTFEKVWQKWGVKFVLLSGS